MKYLWNKKIHQKEFRLRILTTDICNKNCSFCLNDFQQKAIGNGTFVNPFEISDLIKIYCKFMKSKKEIPIITFSGGEPGLHPNLRMMVEISKFNGALVKIVTNGLALNHSLKHSVDCWHIGVTEREIFHDFHDFNIIAQIVVTDGTTDRELLNLVSFYVSQKIPVKLFVDFYSDNQKIIENKIENIHQKYPKLVYSRYTGKQTNRGKACDGCTKKCVTLKALWVFPNNKVSTCPQGERYYLEYNTWYETVEVAYDLHCRR